MLVTGVIGEPRPAVGAQARAILPAQWLERQCKHYRIPQLRLEVEQVALQPAGALRLVLVSRVVRVVVEVQLLERHLDLVVDLVQTPHALTDELGASRRGGQYPLDHRLEPDIELDG